MVPNCILRRVLVAEGAGGAETYLHMPRAQSRSIDSVVDMGRAADVREESGCAAGALVQTACALVDHAAAIAIVFLIQMLFMGDADADADTFVWAWAVALGAPLGACWAVSWLLLPCLLFAAYYVLVRSTVLRIDPCILILAVALPAYAHASHAQATAPRAPGSAEQLRLFLFVCTCGTMSVVAGARVLVYYTLKSLAK